MRWLDRFDRALQQIEDLARTAPVQDETWCDKQMSRWRDYRGRLGEREARTFAAGAQGQAPRIMGPSRGLKPALILMARGESRGERKQGFQAGFPVSK